MRVILKPGILALAAESDQEQTQLAAWSEAATGHVFHFATGSRAGAAFHDLGIRDAACREPINVTFDGPEEWRLISNLAAAPFWMDGRSYASVEGFWQGLKTNDEKQRRRLGELSGLEAKRAGQSLAQPDTFSYEGRQIAAGGPGHRDLMLKACKAKFEQNPVARQALLATGDRPLTHRVRRDSRTIPGVLLADFWMRIRAHLRTSARYLETPDADGVKATR